MKIEEIKENIMPEDKAMVAVSCETHIATIDQMLRGFRNADTELGKKIMAELTRYAAINIKWRAEKKLLTPINEM